MGRSGFPLLSWSPLFLFAISACGSGRQLQSVSVSPASADAKNFSGGHVQFTATGTFNRSPSPSPVTSPAILWCVGEVVSGANPTAGICSGNNAQFASVNQSGVAQCTSTPPGQVTTYILAGVPSKPVGIGGGQPLRLYGSAQLTCP